MKKLTKKLTQKLLAVLALTFVGATAVGCQYLPFLPGNNSTSTPTESTQPGDSSIVDPTPGDSSVVDPEPGDSSVVDPTPTAVIVTFDANGGALEGDAEMEVDENGNVVDYPLANREGYRFSHWEKADGTEVDPMWDTITESVTLYAQWVKICMITFNANGGVVGSETVEVDEGGILTNVPTATKEGTDFYGWYTAAEGGEKVEFTAPITGDMVVYAQYGAISMPIKNLMNTEGTEQVGYRVEAEDAKITGEPSSENNANPGTHIENVATASGGHSIGFLGTAGKTITFTFNAAEAGEAEIAVRMSSNNMQMETSGGSYLMWVEDQVVGEDAFTAEFNGQKISFENATLRGAGKEEPNVWNKYWDPVSFGKVNLVKGFNTIVITVVSSTIPNTDCLDIITDIELTSANGDVATGSENQAAAPKPAVSYDKAVAAKLFVDGYEGGPAVYKTILTFEDDITAENLANANLAVAWGGTLGNANTNTVYLCNEDGDEITAEAGKMVAIEYAVKYSGWSFQNNLSPFSYNNMNQWKDKNAITLQLGSLTIGETEYTKFGGTLTAEIVTPVLDTWDVDNTYTKGDKTLNYAYYQPTIAEGETKPLIVWLHGAGEGGNDATINVLGNDVTELSKEQIQQYFEGAYVLAPQAPTMWMDIGGGTYAGANENTSIYINALTSLIYDFVQNTPGIDKTRVYVGGCSNGGWMTLEVVSYMGDFFAAAYPVCAPYYENHFSEAQMANLAKVPMWLVAAANDNTVRLQANGAFADQNSTGLYLDLLGKNNNLYFSLFENVNVNGTNYDGHWSWIWVFRDEVKYVQAKEGAEGAAFGLTDYNPASTLEVTIGETKVNMWQWLATFTSESEYVWEAITPEEEPVTPPAPPAAGEAIILEAETAADLSECAEPSWWQYFGGGTFVTERANASGGAAVESINTVGNKITFKYTAAAEGKATLSVRLASNANAGKGATEFTTSIFTVTVNGVEVPFEAQTVEGGADYGDVYGDVVIGEVNLVAGENVIVINVLTTEMGNLDCLKITTAVALA